MDFDEYQKHAERTSGVAGARFLHRVDWKQFSGEEVVDVCGNPTFDWGGIATAARAEKRLMAACMGLAGEAGELVDYLKKVVAHGHTLDVDRVKKEGGDVLWYVGEILSCFGISMNEVAELNVEKLRARYGEKFSSEKSINRTPE